MSFKGVSYHQVVSSKVYELIHKYLALSVPQLYFARKFCRIFFVYVRPLLSLPKCLRELAVLQVGRIVFVLRCVWADVPLGRIVFTVPLGHLC